MNKFLLSSMIVSCFFLANSLSATKRMASDLTENATELTRTSKRVKISDESEDILVTLYQPTRLEGNKTNLTVLHQIADDTNHPDYFEALAIIRVHGNRDNYGYSKVAHDRLLVIALDPKHPKQINAAQLLRYHGTAESAPVAFNILKEIAEDDAHPLQAKAVFSLFKGIDHHLEFRPLLEKIAKNPKHPKVAKAADYLCCFINSRSTYRDVLMVLRAVFEDATHPDRLGAALTLKRYGSPVDEVMVNDYLCTTLQDMDHPRLFETTFPFFSSIASDEEKALARPALRHLAQNSKTRTKHRAASMLLRDGNAEDKVLAREVLLSILQDVGHWQRRSASYDLPYEGLNEEEKALVRPAFHQIAQDTNHFYQFDAIDALENSWDDTTNDYEISRKGLMSVAYDEEHDQRMNALGQLLKSRNEEYRTGPRDILKSIARYSVTLHSILRGNDGIDGAWRERSMAVEFLFRDHNPEIKASAENARRSMDQYEEQMNAPE